jgi:predicted PurR-regulated permease PerM
VPKQVEATRAQLARIRGPFGAPFAHLVSITSGGTAKAPNAPNEPGGASSGLAGFAGRAFGTTSSVLAALVEVVLLAAFVLAADDVWPRRLDTAVASAERRREVVAAVARTRSAVARYVLATALINVGQGVLVALVAWLVHMPTPPLWGVLTFVAEFVPYLGGAVMIVLLLIVGLATVGGARALAMPAAYLVITTLQNNLVSPIVYGRGLRLSPAAILLAVMVWWALWGVAGAFLAVPILAALRIVADYVETLRPIGPFLDA